jgi:hypothetical protein
MSAALAIVDDAPQMPRRTGHLYLVAVDGRIVEQTDGNTTQHLNLDAKGAVQSPIETVLFIDGLKRVLQTKKSATVDGNTVLIDSGRVYFDVLGRTTDQYYPSTETAPDKPALPGGSDGLFNTTKDSEPPTHTDYDVLDRTVQTTLPDTTTKMAYGIGIGIDGSGTRTRFTTLVTDCCRQSRIDPDAETGLTHVDFQQSQCRQRLTNLMLGSTKSWHLGQNQIGGNT